MRAFVFTDKALTGQVGRFAWLEMDTEKAKNAALRTRFPVEALPTFFIVDPRNEKVALRWVGGATVPQMLKILADGHAAVARAHGSAPLAAGPSRAADQAFDDAERAYGEASYAKATPAYRAALAAAPPGWSHRGRAVESLLYSLSQLDSTAAVAALARDEFPRLRRTSSSANVAASGLDAALSLPADDPGRARLIATLEADSRELVGDRTAPIAADDRSSVYGSLIDARDDAHDSTGALATKREWSAFLDGEAAKGKTPDERAVYDSHRLAAYLALGEPERAVPMLQASEKAMPNDYNPPARLATAYKAMKRWDDALAASDRAMAKAYGPRKLGFYQTRADIFVGRGDTAAAKRTLGEAIAMADSLPPGQRSERTIATLRKKLDALK
jgi:hypothetical protein